MRTAGLLVALAVSACAQPEDVFQLSGLVVDGLLTAMPGREVRLLRSASLDRLRCVPLLPFATTTTAADGRYRFEVSRQQVSGAFRVELDTPSGGVASLTFLFPQGNLQLPPLRAAEDYQPLPALAPAVVESLDEAWVDGWLSWRGRSSLASPTEDRAGETAAVRRQFGYLDLVLDDLGTTAFLGLDSRVEAPRGRRWVDTSQTPMSRGVACSPSPDGDACPLTDGRFLPVRLPQGTLALDFSFEHVVSIHEMTVRGLVMAGEPVGLRLQWSDAPGAEWKPWVTSPLDPGLLHNARLNCDEPGTFGWFKIPTLAGAAVQQVRLTAVDAELKPLPLLWASEVSFR